MSGARDPATGLTPQQEAFAQRVAAGDSQAAAYRSAYPRSRAWADKAVHVQASMLAARPKVARRIAALTAEIRERAVERAVIDRARTLEEIARIAFSDIRSVFDERGQLRDIRTLSPAERACIASIEVERRTGPDGERFKVIRLKLWNKVEALEKLAKHLGLYEADHRQRANGLFDGLPREVVQQVLQLIDRLLAEHGAPAAPAADAAGTRH